MKFYSNYQKILKVVTFCFVIIFFNINSALPIEIQIEKNAVLSLNECINIALQNNPQIAIYENYKKISKNKVGQAKSDYAPRFGVGTGYHTQNNRQDDVSRSDNYYSADFSLNQLIYNFGKTSAKINMQKFNLIAAEFDFDNIVLQTIYKTKLAYYEVLAARANQEIYKQNVNINEREYNRTKAFFEEGLKSKIDLVNAEVNLSDAKIQLINAENLYKTALVGLNNTMFVAYAPEYSIKTTETFNVKNNILKLDLKNVADKKTSSELPECEKNAVYSLSVEKKDILNNYVFKPYELNQEEAIVQAYKNRPDLKSLEAVVSAMKESLNLIKREYYPELTGRVGYSLKNTSHFFSNGLSFSAGLDIPTINPLSLKYQIDEAKNQLDIAEKNVELLKQNIYFDVQTAYINMAQLEKKIPLLEVKVKQSLENYELADGRYEVGLGNFLELQDAKINYNNAQLAYVQAVFDYNTARINVEKSMGVYQE